MFIIQILGGFIMLPELGKEIKLQGFFEKIFKVKEINKNEELYEKIRETRNDINACAKNLEYTNEESVIDMYIYTIRAKETEYERLIRIAKRREEGIFTDDF